MTKGSWNLPIGLLLICLLLAPPVRAQQSSTDDLRKEIQALSETVKYMQKDLQEIKALLRAGRRPLRPKRLCWTSATVLPGESARPDSL